MTPIENCQSGSNNFARVPQIAMQELSNEFGLYVIYAYYAGDTYEPVQHRNRFIASQVGCSVKTLKKYRNSLWEKGYIRLFYRDLYGEIQEVTDLETITTFDSIIVHVVDVSRENQLYLDMGRPHKTTLKMLLRESSSNDVLIKIQNLIPTRPQKSEKRLHAGYIYVIEGMGIYKIGRTKSLQKRLITIANSLPFEIKVVHVIKTKDTVNAEKQLHAQYEDKRIRREWFALTDFDVEEIKQIKSIEVSL